MINMGLSSKQILDFIPLDTWTSVFVLPSNKTNIDGTYMVSTNEKYLKRCQDMYKMAIHSYKFKKVCSFEFMKLVAVEIEGLWCRGRMLSFNEFLVENTVVDLIDSGSIIKKQLCDLYILPDSFIYDPLCLAIKPVNETPDLKLKRLYIQPLLLESELHKGYVVVNIKDTVNEFNSETNVEETSIKTFLSLADETKSICNINNSECSEQGNSVIQNSNKFNDLLSSVEKPGFENKYVIDLSNELIEVFITENKINMDTLFEIVNNSKLDNIFFEDFNNVPKFVSEEQNLLNDTILMNKEIVAYSNKASIPETNKETSIINYSCVKNFNTFEQNLFQNGSLVQFCYGANIDFVFIRSYEQKQKYSCEMKQFYNYYKKKDNLKIKDNPKSGDLVAANLVYYNEIHRAVILNKNVKHGLGHLFLCFFIDIGCKEYIKSNNIFYLFEEAKNVPYLAHKVGMQTMPFNNTMQLKYLKNYFDELYLKPLIMEFDECDPNALNKVILKNKVNNMDIYSEVKEYIKKNLLNIQQTNDEEVKSKIIDYLNLNDILKNGNLVSITYYFSINQIYVRINTSELTEYYKQITTEVNQFYINTKGVYHRIEPRIGEKVAVKSPSKDQFARAIIMKKIDESYLVHFVDYGSKEIVKKMDIFVLPYKFRHLPQSVIKIGLNVAFPLNKVKKLPDYFNHLIQSAIPLIVEFDEEDPLGFQKVILKMLNGVNLFEEICNLPE